jgi:hypothetical protein
VVLDVVRPPLDALLARFLEGSAPVLELAHGHLAIALGQGDGGEELGKGQREIPGAEALPDVAAARVGGVEGVHDPFPQLEAHALAGLVDDELAGAG